MKNTLCMRRLPERHEIVKALRDTVANHDAGSIFTSQRVQEIIDTTLSNHEETGKKAQIDRAVASYQNAQIDRRDFLKMLGLMTASGAVTLVAWDRIMDGEAITGMQTSTNNDYRTVTVGSGQTKHFTVGSNDVFENVLINVEASGAESAISANGNNWAVRNVGIKGPIHDKGDTSVMSAKGNGVIDHVYFGDGASLHGTRRVGVISNSSHAGHIYINNIYLQGISSNGMYFAGSARIRPPGKTDGKGGNHTIKNSYFKNNNVAHLRIAADGSLVENCVFHNTNQVPALGNSAGGLSDVVNSRGFYTGYGDPSQVVEVRNCDIDITHENTCTEEDYNHCAASVAYSGTHNTYGHCSTIRITDSQVKGKTSGEHVETQNNGSNPSHNPPEGVPVNAEEAASGTSTARGVDTAPDGTNPGSDSPC